MSEAMWAADSKMVQWTILRAECRELYERPGEARQ